MSPALATVKFDPDPESSTGDHFLSQKETEMTAKLFPSFDRHHAQASHYRKSCTSIYKTRDGRFFNLHGTNKQ